MGIWQRCCFLREPHQANQPLRPLLRGLSDCIEKAEGIRVDVYFSERGEFLIKWIGSISADAPCRPGPDGERGYKYQQQMENQRKHHASRLPCFLTYMLWVWSWFEGSNPSRPKVKTPCSTGRFYYMESLVEDVHSPTLSLKSRLKPLCKNIEY